MASASGLPSALPYVSWSSATFAEVPADAWERVYGSMQALKAHVQDYPGCQKFEAYVEAAPRGSVRIHCYTTWDTPEQLEVFLDRGYTFARMLVDAGLEAEPTRVMEKVF